MEAQRIWWEHAHSVAIQVAAFVTLYGVQFSIANIWISVTITVGLGAAFSWNEAMLGGALIAIMLAYAMRVILGLHAKRELHVDAFEYVVHLLYTPAVLFYTLDLHVTETNYPVGVVLGGLLWGLGWMFVHIMQLYGSSVLFYRGWAGTTILALVLSFFFYHTHWVAVLVTTAASVLLAFLSAKGFASSAQSNQHNQ